MYELKIEDWYVIVIVVVIRRFASVIDIDTKVSKLSIYIKMFQPHVFYILRLRQSHLLIVLYHQ